MNLLQPKLGRVSTLLCAMLLLAALLTGCLPQGSTALPTEPSRTEPAPTEPPQTEPPQTEPPVTEPPEPTDAIDVYASANALDPAAWPEHLHKLLEKNPETKSFVLQYPALRGTSLEPDLSQYEGSETVPLFMQWDPRWGYLEYGSDVVGLTGCGPVTLSMAAYYLTKDPSMSPNSMVAFAQDNGYCVPGNGTAWTLISEGAVKLGFDVTEIPMVKSRILANLEVGNPIICVMGPGDFTDSGHYVVMVGTEDGKIRINDCNSRARSEQLWTFEQLEDQTRVLWVIRKFS